MKIITFLTPISCFVFLIYSGQEDQKLPNLKKKPKYEQALVPFIFFPRREKIFYRRKLLFTPIPTNAIQFKEFSLEKITSCELKEFLITAALAGIHNIQSNGQEIGPDIGRLILTFIPIDKLTCGLKSIKKPNRNFIGFDPLRWQN